jgi:hypothetical protein
MERSDLLRQLSSLSQATQELFEGRSRDWLITVQEGRNDEANDAHLGTPALYELFWLFAVSCGKRGSLALKGA